ncbi:hypothetical protein SPRG_02037 [Saprolegnia parasitica CBS 223.65]|uniref:C2H2-type domain-containing protein n=1 Tax=Saprolegnia parasitica (strain CBS 223.65) TaxID=695850 RepID=A0A067D2I8_SAPPC|nr:hypothetical protein SPRG_02037 [Saprolegnia parasitica CBS 223.65]KDO33227.1 hypothetical protein SPRG_02037 [Saprolegnia parasitica CBS 223.65]|eukprot:XP_012195984.1 hypothetical protein SPRG_02037 [Saprolegnia parasitica CBS 223.65]
MSQVFVVDNVPVAAATHKLAQFKAAQNLKIEIDHLRDDDSSDLTTPSAGQTPMGTEMEKKKRRRRTAAQIDRKWTCTYTGCRKAYGSEGSLTQHMRLKHRNLSLAHRERANLVNLSAVYYTAAANNIAIRPALNFGIESGPFLSQLTPPGIDSIGFLTSPEHGALSSSSDSPQKQLRSRSNSMPVSSEYDCVTPMRQAAYRRRTTSTTTPTSNRVPRQKTTTPRNLPRTNVVRKKRSQSMTSSTPSSSSSSSVPPMLVTRLSDSNLSSTIEGLSLSPSYTYFEASSPHVARQPLVYPMLDANYVASSIYSPMYTKSQQDAGPYSLLNTLDWHNASASKTNRLDEPQQQPNDLCVKMEPNDDAMGNNQLTHDDDDDAMVLQALADYESSPCSPPSSPTRTLTPDDDDDLGTMPIPFKPTVEPWVPSSFPEFFLPEDFSAYEALPEGVPAPSPELLTLADARYYH